MFSVLAFLVIAAFIAAVISPSGHCPLFVAVVLLCIVELLRILPLG